MTLLRHCIVSSRPLNLPMQALVRLEVGRRVAQADGRRRGRPPRGCRASGRSSVVIQKSSECAGRGRPGRRRRGRRADGDRVAAAEHLHRTERELPLPVAEVEVVDPERLLEHGRVRDAWRRRSASELLCSMQVAADDARGVAEPVRVLVVRRAQQQRRRVDRAGRHHDDVGGVLLVLARRARRRTGDTPGRRRSVSSRDVGRRCAASRWGGAAPARRRRPGRRPCRAPGTGSRRRCRSGCRRSRCGPPRRSGCRAAGERVQARRPRSSASCAMRGSWLIAG